LEFDGEAQFLDKRESVGLLLPKRPERFAGKRSRSVSFTKKNWFKIRFEGPCSEGSSVSIFYLTELDEMNRDDTSFRDLFTLTVLN
jgi:hypothetical protein